MEDKKTAPQEVLEGQRLQENSSAQGAESQPFEPLFITPELLEEDLYAYQEDEDAYWKAQNKLEREKKQSITSISLSELLLKEFPPKEYIVYPIIPKKGLAMLFAGRGVGKTYVGLNIAYSVACGGSFLNWHAEKARKVLYIDGEMPAQTIKERLSYIVNSNEQEVQEGYFNIVTPDLQEDDVFMPNLATQEGQDAIEPMLEGIELVVVDNLATLARNGRANEEESWRPMQDWVLKLRRRGISVLLVHHASKNGSQRGTSSKEDVLDTVIELKRPNDYETEQGARFEVHLTKARGIFGEEAEPFEAQLNIVDYKAVWEVSRLQDVLVDKIKALNDEGLSQREIAEETGVSKSKINRIMKQHNIVKKK